jgi:hypothetical protein
MVRLIDVQIEVGEWSNENFGEQPSSNALMGAGEEMGELIHSILKRKQGIRMDEEDVGVEAERDAIGDIAIYLMDFLYREGFMLDLTEPIREDTQNMADDMEEEEVIGLLFSSYARLWDSYDTFEEERTLQSVVMVFICLDVLCQMRERLGGLEYCVDVAWNDEVKEREWDSEVEE